MRKFTLLFTLVTTLLLLTGCTVESDRIYNVCKIDSDGTQYCYNDLQEFYVVYNDSVLPISGVGLHPYPTLKLQPSEGTYSFQYELPGKYSGTLKDVNHYVYDLLSDGAASVQVLYSDPYILDFKVIGEKFTTRIIYNKSGSVRIYCETNSGKSRKPLYINK